MYVRSRWSRSSYVIGVFLFTIREKLMDLVNMRYNHAFVFNFLFVINLRNYLPAKMIRNSFVVCNNIL